MCICISACTDTYSHINIPLMTEMKQTEYSQNAILKIMLCELAEINI